MGSVESVPGCFGYYPKAIFPNNCIGCAWVALCKKVVAKERLAAVLADVKEAKATVRG
jgi:hypothetical protein